MIEDERNLREALLTGLQSARRYILLFYIWGLQGTLAGGLDLILQWYFPAWIRTVSVTAALLLSVIVVLLPDRARQTGAQGLQRNLHVLWRCLPAFMLVGSVLLLRYTEAASPFFADYFKALLLSFFYVQLGVLLGRELVYLGIWLFALCVVLAFRYYGFAPVVLELFGGLSLIACGSFLRRRSTNGPA